MTAVATAARTAGERARRVWGASGPGPAVGRWAVSFGALYVLLVYLFRNNAPPQGTYLYGAILGLLYGLVAFGLILVYRANRIINFANAEIGAACAGLAVLLMKSRWEVPYVAALFLALGSAVVAGALVEYLVIRRFSHSPRLILSVATIGVALIFAALQFFMPHWITGRFVDPAPPKTPFTELKASVGGTIFSANHLVIVFAVALVVVGLTAFFRFTDIGLAVRAAAENRDRASLLGIPVKRVSTVVWILSSVMAAIGVFLRAPVIGLPIGALVGPSVLLYALAAAVVARMESFTVALGAAVAFGVLEQTFYAFGRDPNLGSALTLPILLVVMLFQHSRQSRGQDAGIATWSLGQEFRPVPPELRTAPEVQWGQFGLRALVVAAAVGAPLVMDVFQQNLASVILIYGMVGVTLVVLVGWAGQISLGQWGFVGVGAATAGGMFKIFHADFFLALLAAGVVGAVAAVLIGLPALRIQGLYLAVTTLAFAIATQVYLLSPNYSDWLIPARSTGIERPLLYGRFDLADDRTFYFLTLGLLGLALLSARSLRNSRTGRILVATRDNPRGAQSFGVSVAGARLTAFAFAGFWAGLAGGLFAYHQRSIDTLAYSPSISLDVLVMSVIGGITSLPGALLGTGVIGFFKYGRFSAQTQFFATGVGVLVILLVLPGGLAQIVYGARDNLLRRVAAKRGIHVPSLVADAREAEEERAAADRAIEEATGTVEEVAALEEAGVATVMCPACGETLTLDDVPGHEHFHPDFVGNGGRGRRARVPEAQPRAKPERVKRRQ